MASLSAKLSLPRTTATATCLSSTPPDSMQRTGEHLRTSPWPGCPVDQNLLWSLPEAGQMQALLSGLLDPAVPCFYFLSFSSQPSQPLPLACSPLPCRPLQAKVLLAHSSFRLYLGCCFPQQLPSSPCRGAQARSSNSTFPLPRFHSYLTGPLLFGTAAASSSPLQIQCVYLVDVCAQVGSRTARSIVWSWVCGHGMCRLGS